MFTKANAKINLGFNVLSKKDDGYHLIDSIYLPLTLHDSIEIQIIPGANDTYVTCDSFVSIPSTYNLAHIAISKARDIFHFKEQFRINIHKSIPMGAGLGGGSSDAAACLSAIFKMLNIHPSKEELRSLALSVGADVVYFLLLDEPARVDGVGERLRPIEIKKDYYCLLVKPDESLSTKEVYEKSDEYEDLPVANLDAIERGLKEGDDELIATNLSNALYIPAKDMLPKLVTIENQLKEFGFKIVCMSGSGSSFFALSDNKKIVKKAEAHFDKLGYTVERCKIYKKEEKR